MSPCLATSCATINSPRIVFRATVALIQLPAIQGSTQSRAAFPNLKTVPPRQAGFAYEVPFRMLPMTAMGGSSASAPADSLCKSR
ncbi:protein of unknown function [Rhodovastum atsumiense]|nr:protein of unknown function [Rhodovastum atsumiense]